MKKAVILAAVLGIIFTACQKEIDWGFDQLANQQLVKILSVSGSDSTTVSFSYDLQRRLIKTTQISVTGGTASKDTFIINRNSSGIITTTVARGDQLQGLIDSIETRYFYNTTMQQYYAATRKIDIGGFMVTDSAVYTYDGSGKINLEKHYLVTGFPGIPVTQVAEVQYTFSSGGNNLVTMKQFAATTPGGGLTPISTENYTYDAKTNPLLLKNEAILLGLLNYFSVNNATQDDYVDETDPTQNTSTLINYKYNVVGRPDSSFATQSPAGTVTNSKYYYQ